jgi:uncharacterized protein
MRIHGFDWDDGNWPKCGKHGVTKNEIESLFEDDPNLYPDVKHSRDEIRHLASGELEEAGGCLSHLPYDGESAKG